MSRFSSPLHRFPNLTVSDPGDREEREAERVADTVMRSAAAGAPMAGLSASREPRVQHMCSRCQCRAREGKALDCPECEKEVQGASSGDEERVSGASSSGPRLQSFAGSGQPLPSSVQRFFETRFGRSFEQVRLHKGASADQAAQSIRARAFTIGQDIAFRSGEYAPNTPSGRELLAHELTHVVQQTGAYGGGTDGQSGLRVQRMAECPEALGPTDPVPSGWKEYQGDTDWFHCGFRGMLEDRSPTPDDPQNECFYDPTGTLVTDDHEFSGCQGTPNQYDSSEDPIWHTLFDSGGIAAKGGEAYAESRRYDKYRHLPNMCLRICSARFDRCVKGSRMSGMDCIPAFQRCTAQCPEPSSGDETPVSDTDDETQEE